MKHTKAIITLLHDAPTWTLTASERRRLSDYLRQVLETLQRAQEAAK